MIMCDTVKIEEASQTVRLQSGNNDGEMMVHNISVVSISFASIIQPGALIFFVETIQFQLTPIDSPPVVV